MKKTFVWFLLPAAVVLVGGLAGCASANGGETTEDINLVIHNSEDYILGNPKNDQEDPDNNLVARFEKYCKETDHVNVHVTYETFSVMEDELSNLQTGGHSADLVCVSDYIIQKLMRLNMVTPFLKGEERDNLYREGHGLTGWETDTYDRYASGFLKDHLTAIEAPVGGDETQMGTLGDYARGYMWGTLGLTYNPAFQTYADRGLSAEDVKVQMSDWNALWDSHYAQTFQIKDSMRDTYSIGLMHVYDDFFKTLLSWYQAGTYSYADTGETGSYGTAQYNADVSTIFNNVNHIADFNALGHHLSASFTDTTPDFIVDAVQTSLSQLKDESFGLEVDQGKTDITTGDKSGIDTAWSGDAITSISGGDEAGTTLYYSIPKTGGNIWFDAWVLIKSDSLQQEYAQKFIDFISTPSEAAPNMGYIGYTSFIGGDPTIDLVRDLYDPRTAAMYVYHNDAADPESSDWAYDDDGNKIVKDGSGVHEDTGDDYGSYNMTGSSYEAPVVADHPEITTWDLYAADPAFVNPDEENAWTKVDLSYFFKGTEDEYDAGDMIFYTNELEEVTGHNLAGEEETVLVGRSFLAQYPTEDDLLENRGTALCQIPGLAVMEDYGNNSVYVLLMWENVKAGGTIKPWIVALFVAEGVAALALGLYFGIKGARAKKLRQKRREERVASSTASASPNPPANK
jgi:spermidine/putrescine transport system substrate-binding protein